MWFQAESKNAGLSSCLHRGTAAFSCCVSDQESARHAAFTERSGALVLMLPSVKHHPQAQSKTYKSSQGQESLRFFPRQGWSLATCQRAVSAARVPSEGSQ